MNKLLLALFMLLSSQAYALALGDEANFLHVKIGADNKRETFLVKFVLFEYDRFLRAYKIKRIDSPTKASLFGKDKISYFWAEESKINVNLWVDNSTCFEARRNESSYLSLINDKYEVTSATGCLFKEDEVEKLNLFDPFFNADNKGKIYLMLDHENNFTNIMRVDKKLETYQFIKK